MKLTTDHNEIKAWVQKHHGKPELIDHPEARADTVGIRIDFPGHEDDALLSDTNPPKNISWDEFFQIFDEEGLAFEYDDAEFADNPTYAYRFANRNSTA